MAKGSKIVFGIILFLLCPLFGIIWFMCVDTSKKYKERKIDGYEPWNGFKRMLKANPKLTPFVWEKPSCLDEQLYHDIVTTLTTYQKPDEEMIKKMAKISLNMEESETKELISSVFLGLTLRETGELRNRGHICDIVLKPNEELFFKSKNMFLERYKTLSVEYTNMCIKSGKNGLRYTNGTISQRKNEGLSIVSELGTLYVTNKRMIYIDTNTKQTYEIPLNIILQWYIDNDSVIIVPSNRKPYKFTNVCNFTFNKESSTFDDGVFDLGNTLKCLIG